jgi:cold shock protein
MQGKVVWFSSAKGYGFLQPSDGSQQIFCHFSAIEAEGYKKLNEGDHVQFDVVKGNKGQQAANVIVLKQ